MTIHPQVADTVGRCNRFFNFQTCQIVEDNEHIFRDSTLTRELYFLPHFEPKPRPTLTSMVSDVSLPDWFFRNQSQDIEVVTEDEPLNQEEQEQGETICEMDDHLPL